MQFRLYGKVIARTVRHVKRTDGSSFDRYSMVIEEPGQYPSRFQVQSKDPSIFGQNDGPFGIGKFVTATGFVNGQERDAKRQDGTPFKSYNVWLTLKTLEPSGSAEPPTPAASDVVDEDIPL